MISKRKPKRVIGVSFGLHDSGSRPCESQQVDHAYVLDREYFLKVLPERDAVLGTTFKRQFP